MIMTVMTTLSATEIEYVMPTLMAPERHIVPLGCEIW
jgi:hypothetical protein